MAIPIKSNDVMKRREFLLGSAAMAAPGVLRGQRPDPAKLNRIAVMLGSFNSLVKRAENPGDPKRTIDLLDLPGVVAERFGIRHVELQHTQLPTTETAYLREFRDRLKKTKSQVSQINLEFGERTISAPNLVRRLEAVDLTKQWIDHAAVLGCPRVMMNQGKLEPEVRPAAIEALKAVNAYGKAKKVFVTMENRIVPWELLVEVIKAAGIWANPDTGNFPDKEARAAGLAVMYKMTCGSSHVKHIPDRFSTPEGMQIAKDAGYTGLFSIEAGSRNGPDPYTSVQTVLDALLASM